MRSVKQWFDVFNSLESLSSHAAADKLLQSMLPWDECTQGRVDELANAMTAWRMLPTATHIDPDRPWYDPLPAVGSMFKTTGDL